MFRFLPPPCHFFPKIISCPLKISHSSFFIFHSSFKIGRAASPRTSARLASGYPLHQPLRLRRGRGQSPAPTRLVPLLSLSLPRQRGRNAPPPRKNFNSFGRALAHICQICRQYKCFLRYCCFRFIYLRLCFAYLNHFCGHLCHLHAHFKQNTCFRLNGLLQWLNGLLQRPNGLLQWLNGLLQRPNRLLQRLNRLLQRHNGLLQWHNGQLQRLNGRLQQLNGRLQCPNGLLH